MLAESDCIDYVAQSDILLMEGRMKKTKVISLYGGPGTGKSTTGSLLFAHLKMKDINCELVREYIKDWIWEGRAIKSTDQVYILAKQARREQILYGAVDVVITDSPMWLSPVYEQKLGTAPYVCEKIVEKFQKEAEAVGVEYIHVFLKRVKKYNPAGRYQDENGAKAIDQEIKEYLIAAKIPFLEVEAKDGAALEIISKLNL